MFHLLETNLENMCNNLNQSYHSASLTKARELENTLNQFRKKVRKEHFISVEKGEYTFQSTTIYADLFNSLEKVGDHNVNEGKIEEN